MDCKISNKVKKLIIFFIISLLLTKSNELIEIEGNFSFDDKIISQLIKSSPQFLDSNEESKSLHLDLLAIKSFYQNNGFLDVNVTHKVKENKFFYIINESVQYYNGDIVISGNELFKDEDIKSQFLDDLKTPFNPNSYRASILKLKNQYLENGKIAVKINDDLIKEGNKININLKIEEGDTYFINDIKIIGLNQIDEKYILRESEPFFDKGDIFSNTLINDFQNRLFKSDLFSSVYIDTEIAKKNNVDIKVLIVEFENMNESYIDLGFGKDIGINSDLKNYFLCASKNKMRNILNSGNNLNLNFELNVAFNSLIENAEIVPDFKLDASLNSGWFFTRSINTEIQFQIDQIYNQNNEQLLIYSLDLILSDKIRKYTRINKFTFKRADFSPNNANYFSYKLTLDRTEIDNFMFPKSGSIRQFNYSYNLNIDDFSKNYNKLDLNLINYFSITDKTVYANRFYLGMIFNSSDSNILPDDYFQLGGANSLRAWGDYSDYMDWLELSYNFKNIDNNYSEDCFLMNHEIRYRHNSKISAQIFIDSGQLFISENQGKLDWNYGVGFSYFTALGPIRVDFAKIGSNINKNKSYISLAFLYAF